jgi:L,D-peptidoglycan transpeptidase YkuD (ErfK/YbiS/YcfS/YnhG family)
VSGDPTREVALASADVAAAPPPAALRDCRQLLRVLAAGWEARAGVLQRFVRPAPEVAWQPAGASIPVSLGRKGLAWGEGLHPSFPSLAGPQKREGDGRAPAGLFAVTGLFGAGAASATLGQAPALPYLVCHRDLYAVDDPASRHYNRIVDAREVACDWQSAEAMLRDDDRYAVAAVIAHNPAGLAGAGSCIFLHVHAGPGLPTAGCTAADRPSVRELCAWLDAAAGPLLLQLPADVYDRWQVAWALPPRPDDSAGRP